MPINLKINNGKAPDNAYSKIGVLATVSCTPPVRCQNMDMNTFYKTLVGCVKLWKGQRQPLREYHYLVVHKITGQILLKSILDIHTFFPNPSNIFQIKWDHEFKHMDYRTPVEKSMEKFCEILEIIQKSLRRKAERSQQMIDADIRSDLFTPPASQDWTTVSDQS
jgi:hypothetical protein